MEGLLGDSLDPFEKAGVLGFLKVLTDCRSPYCLFHVETLLSNYLK